jgi:hypothetical protein
MNRRNLIAHATLLMSMWGVASCDDPSEAPRVELPVAVDASGVAPLTTDLGYAVEVTSARVALEGLVFTVAGEAHTASLWRKLSDAVVPPAVAHPGHFQGGEVTGELPGEFVVEWPAEDGRELGVATLIAGTYSAANFTFARGAADDLGADDPLVGHTAIVTGTATKDGQTTTFTFVVDSPEGRVLVGAPFEAEVTEDAAGTLNIQFHPADALEGDTLFDAIDFAALDGDGDGAVTVSPDDPDVEDAYILFRRTFQTHDHYTITYEEQP